MNQKLFLTIMLLMSLGQKVFAQPTYEEQQRKKRIEKADADRLNNHHYEDFTPSKTYSKPTAEELKKIGESETGQAWMKLLHPNYKTPEQVKAANATAAEVEAIRAKNQAESKAAYEKVYQQYLMRMKRVNSTVMALTSAGFNIDVRDSRNQYSPFLEQLQASLPDGSAPDAALLKTLNYAVNQIVRSKKLFTTNKNVYTEAQLVRLVADYTPFYTASLNDLDTLSLRFGNTTAIDSLRILSFCFQRGLNAYSIFPPETNFPGWIESYRMDTTMPAIFQRHHDLVINQLYYYSQTPYNFDFDAQEIALSYDKSYRSFKQALRKMKPADKAILSAWLQIRDEMWSLTKPPSGTGKK